MKKLKNKGFTLVEAIVVIGIIAVMTALVIPIINQGDPRINRGKAYTKAFYFDTQDLMLDLKQEVKTNKTSLNLVKWVSANPLSNVDIVPNDLDHYLFVLQYSDKDNATPSLARALCYDTSGSFAFGFDNYIGIDIDNKPTDISVTKDGASGKITSITNANKAEDLQLRFANRTQPMDDEYGGYLYAVVDSKMRVVRTFWTTLAFDKLSTAGFTMSKSGYITATNAEGKDEDYPVASYPIACAENYNAASPFNLLTGTNP